jgi:hypothetical protein
MSWVMKILLGNSVRLPLQPRLIVLEAVPSPFHLDPPTRSDTALSRSAAERPRRKAQAKR